MSKKPRRASDNDVNALLTKAPIENIVESFYNAFLEANIRARADAGIKEMVIREAIGGCCPWCQKLAGIYEYGTEPKDIFKRHDNCTCIVTFRTEEGYTDVWSKKKFETELEARIARVEELEKEVEKIRIFERERRIAKDKNYAFIDATEEWTLRRGKKTGTVRNAKKDEVEKLAEMVVPGIASELKYQYNHDEQEEHIAELLWEMFGGDILLLPEIKYPQNIKMADYLWNGEKFDLKTPEKRNKDTIYNAIHKKKKQAHNFIIDISECGISEEEAISQMKRLYSRMGTKNFVETLILIKDDKIIKILEKI